MKTIFPLLSILSLTLFMLMCIPFTVVLAFSQNPGQYPLLAVHDTYVDEGTPTTNYGSQLHLFVGPVPEFGLRNRIFLRFDFAPLPDDASTMSAELNIYMHFVEWADNVSLDLSIVKESWQEEDITWNTQPETYNPFGSVDISTASEWKRFDITHVVRAWLNGSVSNYGLMISASNESGPIYSRGFYSSETADCDPYVMVSYTTEGIPPEAPDPPTCGGWDTTNPGITITASPNPAVAGESVTISAEATDQGSGVYRVQISRGGTVIADRTVAYLTTSLSTSETENLGPGIYNYSALAWDRNMNGASTSMMLQVLNDGRPPAVQVSHDPLNPDIGETITLTARAEDESGVNHLTIYINNIPHDYHFDPAINPATQPFSYHPSGERIVRYRASATDEEGMYTSTGTKVVLFGNTGPDADKDQLSDEIEDILGLALDDNDTDNDGLYDHWEVFGFDADNDGSIDVDLPEMGASPHQKDVFVEMDWMEDHEHSHLLHPWAIQATVNLYRDYGINLHVDTGNLGGGNSLPHVEEITDCVNDNERIWLLDTKRENFDSNRCGIFYYCAVLHTPPCGSKYLGSGNIILRTGDPGGAYRSPARQAMLFIHELGHAMGLGHGGQIFRSRTASKLGPDGTVIEIPIDWDWDNENNKPNYFSTMNYRYQWELKVRTDEGDTVYIFDYNQPYTFLDESHLEEDIGFEARALLGSYVWRRSDNNWVMYHSRLTGTYFIRPHEAYDLPIESETCPVHTEWFLADGSPIDWDFDGIIWPHPDDYDVNHVCSCRRGGDDCDCECEEHNISTLWARTEYMLLRPEIYGDIFAGFPLAKTTSPYPGDEDVERNDPPEELASDGEHCDGVDNDGDGLTDEGFPDYDDDNIVDMIDNAPFTYNPDQEDNDRNYIGDVAEEPPGVPTDLNGGVVNELGILKWSLPPKPNANIIGYNVYRKLKTDADFRRIGASYPTTLETGFEDTLQSERESTISVEYSVTAVNVYMNESGFSESVILVYTDIEETAQENIPEVFALSNNFPNPFNPPTHIKYQIPKQCHVTLKIFNTLGQGIVTLVNKHQKPGYYNVKWDGKDERGLEIASGVYFSRFKADGFVSTKKMLLLK